MKNYPKWLLALAFLNTMPVFLSVFFLFGGLFKAPSSWGAFIGLLIYLLINLLWILPIVAFFIGLNDYRRGYQKRGIAILVCGNILTLLDILFIL